MQARDTNTMESFQDGGQQNMKSEHSEFPPMEGSHINPEMNNFSHSSGEGTVGSDFSKIPDGMHPTAMQNYAGYNRSNYGMNDQHGGTIASSVDYNSQNTQFSGQFSQAAVRSQYPGMHKSNMTPVRPGMMPPGMGMMPGSYNSTQRMMSANPSGPTPTLNQLLQTPNSAQRFPGNYGDFSGSQGKGEMGSGSSYSVPQQGWNGNPRSMGSSYPQGALPGTPYRSQGSSVNEARRPTGIGPAQGYPHQGQYMSSAMAANAQRYMMGQVRPSHIPPMSGHGYNQQMPPHSQMNYSPSMPNQTSQLPTQRQQQQQQQMFHGQQQQPQPPGQPHPQPQPSPTPTQQHQSLSNSLSSHRPPSSQGASPKQASPAPMGMSEQSSCHSISSKKADENPESSRDNSHAEEVKVENSGNEGSAAGGLQSHLGVVGVRPVPSPAGSTGSRSDTPASNSGAQGGSPMPPRPPSSHLEGQGHTSQLPMATQGYNQQMMPPPMGGQVGYPGVGGKMGSGPGMSGTQLPPHYPQYNSQYPQGGNFRGQPVMGGMQGGPGGPADAIPGNSGYPQAMYNGPGQMGPSGGNMYNNMMSRGMPNYNSPYGPASGMGMNSHYGSFNSHMGPGQGPGPGPGPGSGPSQGQPSSGAMPAGPGQMMPGQMSMNNIGMQPGAPMIPGGKGAQAAAQAALMAAANSAGSRISGRGMAGSPRMMGPQGSGSPSPGSVNHMVGNLGNPSLNSISNQIQQITTSSVTMPGKPASPAGNASLPPSSSGAAPTLMDKIASVNSLGNTNSGGEPGLMSPLSGSDTQESSRPSSTATPSQTVDAGNNTTDNVGSDGSGSMPSSDSTSVDSGFHSAADQSEKLPLESTPTHSSSPSNLNPPSSTNGQCEERASQESEGIKVASSMPSSIPTSVHTASTTTTVTSALHEAALSQSATSSAGSEMLSSGSQTTMSMPMMMSSNSSSSNNSPANPTTNGPHYPHMHPHQNMGYPMGSQGMSSMGGNPHMMSGPGMHHPGMPQQHMTNMPPYNMAQGNMINNMPPGSMSGNMPQGSMPNSMPPAGMMNNSMPHGAMPNSMQQGGMPPGGMPNAPGAMHNSMHRENMTNHMRSSGNMAVNMPPGPNMNSHSMGPTNMPTQSTTASQASAPPPEEPPEKKKKKASDMTKLYDMGNEMDRRPFLDKLLAFLEEKGSPITTMPCISKQPLDLFKLYHCVREKGGFVEVNKGKKWKEICSVVNIGCSASAAFTLKKNYIRYLFSFECKFDLGGLDPAPILQEMESHGDRKRESKKRVPSPGSQSSQDGFQQTAGPNSQMMDGYHGGPGMPPPYMQGPDGQMIPSGIAGPGHGMMMPNNMMGHPGMVPHHPGSGPAMMGGGMGHGPNSMMMGSGMPPSAGPNSGQNMMSGGMVPQGAMMNAGNSMMGPGGMMGPNMHMGPGNYGSGPPPNSMMGSGLSNSSSASMGPSPGPPPIGNASSVSSTAPSSVANGTPGSGASSVATSTSSVALPPSSTPNSRPPTADSVSVQDPFADEPGKSSSPANFQHRPGQPTPSPTPGGFSSPGPPTTSSTAGFGSHPTSVSNPTTPSFSEQGPAAFRRTGEGFPPNSSGTFPGRPEGAQFPYGQENSGHLPQQFHPPSGNADAAYAARFPGQQPPFRAGGPGEAFNSSHPYSSHGPGMGPRMPGQEGFGSFPSPHPGVRASLSRESTYPGTGRESGQWSPLHAQRSFPPTTPNTPPMGYGRPPQRGSPQTRDKVLAAKLQVDQQKSCGVLPNSTFPPKKEIIFPPDSVEATQPTLTKRRRLTHKDTCPFEGWRLVMSLKSGLLAESTWAIDTLNILLFDDTTVTYFNLSNMPGLLEVLTEHFRATLFQIFHILQDRELEGKGSSGRPCLHKMKKNDKAGYEEPDKSLSELVQEKSEMSLDKGMYPHNYTLSSRQGKTVVLDQQCPDCAVLDPKKWDSFCNFRSGRQHWQKGGGDITCHVVPCFESSNTHKLLTTFFNPKRTCSKNDSVNDGCRKRKAASVEDSVHNGDKSANGESGPERKCSKPCERGMGLSVKEEHISQNGGGDHSNTCSQEVNRNRDVTKMEISREPRDSDLHRCESDDSLPPPVLPDATQDSHNSNEGNVRNSPSSEKDEMNEKPTPPELTREENVKEERETDGAKEGSQQCKQSGENKSAEKLDVKGEKQSVCKEDDDDNDAMTAEIVAMMIKEQDGEVEEEAYRHDDPPLTTIESNQQEMGRRCVAISNIFRSLSCIPGNEVILSNHHGLMAVLGQVLLLQHWHPTRSKPQPASPLPDKEEEVGENAALPGETKCLKKDTDASDASEQESSKEDSEEVEKDWATSPEWWWETLESVRENTLVILANICSHMHMRTMPNEVCMPILDGLLHWMVCPSSAACDPLLSASSTSQLSPQRLVLEALCKLCIHDENIDLLLATPPFSRIMQLMGRLMRLLSERAQPVPREFSIVLLSRLVQGDAVAARAVALQHPSIPLLIEFLEAAEQSAMAVASQQGYSAVLNNPEVMGTSLDMLRRSASTLLHMARVPENRKMFVHHQSRLLTLVMSQILDSSVTQIVSDVLYECSQFDPLHT